MSGATEYHGLCVAARNEEKRLADLRKRQQYTKSSQPQPYRPKQPPSEMTRKPPTHGDRASYNSTNGSNARKCFICKKPGHMMKDCKQRRTESRESCHVGVAKQVTAERESSDEPVLVTDLLYSSDSDDGEHVKLISVTDGGSRFQLARVDVQGVPADGVIDTGADITIMGKELFAMVAAAARLRKRDFRKADTVPRTYDRKIFHLDGCMDLDISFADKKMKTTVYIKADAHDQLLLSEGVCRQLGIVTFHPMVQPQKVKKRQRETSLVPTVRVNLVKSLHLLPHQSAVVQVNFEGAGGELKQPMMVESGETAAQTSGLTVEDAVTAQREDGCAQLVITNSWGFTQSLPEGTCVGHAEAVEVVDCELDVEDQDIDLDAALLRRVTSLDTEERKRLLFETLKLPDLLPAESDPLKELLAEHHDVFSLEEGERGGDGPDQAGDRYRGSITSETAS